MKLLKTISMFFTKIAKYMDKLIVVPLTKLVLKISKQTDKSSKQFENWLSKTTTLLFISLVLSIIVFIVIDQKVLFFSSSSAEVLPEQPVKVIYNEEAYVYEGLPKTVDITLIGSKTNLYFAKNSSTQDVVIDLTGLKPGTHKVNIKYNKELPNLDYKVNPSYATVIIYPKISETRTLSYDLLNQEKLSNDKLISNIKLSNDKIVIKGADYKLKQVAVVKALVDINNLLNHEVGTKNLKDIPLKAYDVNGKAVDVEIVPRTVDAEIEISSPNKELPIKIIPIGDVSFGKAISSITVSETKVSVYGLEDDINKLTYIPVEIDVKDLKENKTFKKEITKPNGVRHMSVNNITVEITLDVAANKDIENVNIEHRNLNPNYRPQGTSQESTRVTVSVRGVESVIKDLSEKDVTAYIDLTGYGVGEHEVEVKVEGSDQRVTYSSKTKKIKIIIKEN